MKEPDYYSILQIDPDASLEAVRSAYKRLALLTHPDLSGHPLANQQMQRLNEAFEVLSNPEKRAQYDQDRSAPSALTPVEKPAPAEPEAQVDQKQQKDLGRKWNRLVRNQLKMIAYIVLLDISHVFLVPGFWTSERHDDLVDRRIDCVQPGVDDFEGTKAA